LSAARTEALDSSAAKADRDPDTPPPLARRIVEDLLQLYEARAAREPQGGHAEQAADWRSRLDASAPPPSGNPSPGLQ